MPSNLFLVFILVTQVIALVVWITDYLRTREKTRLIIVFLLGFTTIWRFSGSSSPYDLSRYDSWIWESFLYALNLFLLRNRHLWMYSLIEIFAGSCGVVVIGNSLDVQLRANMPASYQQLLAISGAVYVMIRGADNFRKWFYFEDREMNAGEFKAEFLIRLKRKKALREGSRFQKAHGNYRSLVDMLWFMRRHKHKPCEKTN